MRVRLNGSFFLAYFLLLYCPFLARAQTTSNQIVPFRKVGEKVEFSQPQGSVSFSLQSRGRSSARWIARSTTVANPTNPVLSVDIPPVAQKQNLRIVATVRPPNGQRKNLAFLLAADSKSLTFKPTNQARLYSVERFQSAVKTWARVSTVAASAPLASTVRVSLPSSLGRLSASSLRVVAVLGDAPASSDLSFPVPAQLLSGVSRFAPHKQVSLPSISSMAITDSTRVATLTSVSQDGVAVEEADLWKIRGRKIYLFNQLRGLQVLDASVASNPVVAGFWPLPAVGEDMYLLGATNQPAVGALLLARLPWRGSHPEGTRVLRIALTNDIPSMQTSLDLPGTLQESRMAGTRLHLVTTSWQDEQGDSSPTTWVITLNVSQDGVLVEESRQSIPRYASAVGNTGKYLWLAGSDTGNWSSHTLTAFPIQAGGTLGSPLVAQLGGVIQDKFKVGDLAGGLAAVVQTWIAPDGRWRNRTLVETYGTGLAGVMNRRSQTEIIQDEWLHATRFDGERLYAVTFRQIDPLWLIDLRNPDAPAITSHLEVPGWSSFIEPLGNLLVAVGREGGQAQVSLFDVSDLSNPQLASRVNVGNSAYSWSEAEWNEKAVKILPKSGLILVPVTEWSGGQLNHCVRLLGLDQAGKTLSTLGTIRHDFSPRRASLLDGNLVASVSNRELLLVDATNRGAPVVQSEVTLAFGVDRLATRSGYLYQFENGNSWEGGSATALLRVAPDTDPDGVVAEIPLSVAQVAAAEVIGDRLVVVEGGGDSLSGGWRRWWAPGENSSSGVFVSIWSLQNPSIPSLLGRLTLSGNQVGEVSVLDASPGVAVISRKIGNWYNWSSGRLGPGGGAQVAYCGWFPWGLNNDSLTLDLVRISASPALLGSWSLNDGNIEAINKVQSFGDLLVFGFQKRESAPVQENNNPPQVSIDYATGLRTIALPDDGWWRPRLVLQSRNWLQIVDLAEPTQPSAWAPVEIPGTLIGVSRLERGGGVLFSRSGAGDSLVYALGFDGENAAVAAQVDVGSTRALTIRGNSVYAAGDDGIRRWDFSESSGFFAEPFFWSLPSPGSKQLEITVNGPLVSAENALSTLGNGNIRNLGELPGWPDLTKVRSSQDAWFLPCGPYGTYQFR